LIQTVTDFVIRLAKYEHPVFLEVIRHHDWRVLAGALRCDEFFEQVKDLIPLPTDMGPLTMPKYLLRIPPLVENVKNVYYIPGEQPLGQQQGSLFKAQGIPIVRADMAVEQFLKKYAVMVDCVSLRELQSGVVDLMDPVEGAIWRGLEARYQELGIVAKAVCFEPPEMVGMAVRQEEYDKTRLIEQLIGGSRSLSDYMGRAGREKADAYGLAINAANPIVQQLAEYEGDPTVFNTALRAIFASALLSAGVDLTPELSQGVAQAQMRIIELLLEQSKRIETGETMGPYAPSQFERPETELESSLDLANSEQKLPTEDEIVESEEQEDDQSENDNPFKKFMRRFK
jgi:molecular chaperone HtpG